MSETKEMCPCGFPQSYPIPHEHDQTEREKVIIKHFRDSHNALLSACEAIVRDFEDEEDPLVISPASCVHVPNHTDLCPYGLAKAAIAKANK